MDQTIVTKDNVVNQLNAILGCSLMLQDFTFQDRLMPMILSLDYDEDGNGPSNQKLKTIGQDIINMCLNHVHICCVPDLKQLCIELQIYLISIGDS